MVLRKMQQAAVDKGVSLGFPDAYMEFLRDPSYSAKIYPQLVTFFRAGGGRYVLSEMRGACNKAPGPAAVGYVESFLEGLVP